jgi:hypothetical protein
MNRAMLGWAGPGRSRWPLDNLSHADKQRPRLILICSSAADIMLESGLEELMRLWIVLVSSADRARIYPDRATRF